MALNFRPPQELIQDYLNRPSPGQIASEGMNQAFQLYAQQKAQEQQKALQAQQLALQTKQSNATQFGAVAPYAERDQIPGLMQQYGFGQTAGVTPPTPSTGTVPSPMTAGMPDSTGEAVTQRPSLVERFGSWKGSTSKAGMANYKQELDIQKAEQDSKGGLKKPLLPVSQYSALQSGSAEDLGREFPTGIPGEYVSPALMSTSRNTRIMQDPGSGAITRVPVAGAPGPVNMPRTGGGVDLDNEQNAVMRLRQTAPKVADRFTKIVDDAYPDNNPILRASVEATTAASGVRSILSDKTPSQVGLQSLGFYFARMSGSNSQLSDAERTQFEQPLSLIDRVVNKGYKITSGDLSPQMRKDLSHLADIISAKSKIQGELIISSQKRRAKMELGQLYSPGLDSQFPSMDMLSVGENDISRSLPSASGKKSFINPGEEDEYEEFKKSMMGGK